MRYKINLTPQQTERLSQFEDKRQAISADLGLYVSAIIDGEGIEGQGMYIGIEKGDTPRVIVEIE